MQTRWCKTEAGRNEIQQRTRKLPAGLASLAALYDVDTLLPLDSAA